MRNWPQIFIKPEAPNVTKSPADEADEPAVQVKEEPVEDDSEKRGIKRRASAAFSSGGGEDFKGFAKTELDDSTVDYKRVLGKYCPLIGNKCYLNFTNLLIKWLINIEAVH